MINQANQPQVRRPSTAVAILSQIGQALLSILKGMGWVVKKIAANVVTGFTMFVGTAEEYGLPRDEYRR